MELFDLRSRAKYFDGCTRVGSKWFWIKTQIKLFRTLPSPWLLLIVNLHVCLWSRGHAFLQPYRYKVWHFQWWLLYFFKQISIHISHGSFDHMTKLVFNVTYQLVAITNIYISRSSQIKSCVTTCKKQVESVFTMGQVCAR